MTLNLPRGIETSIDFRLCSRRVDDADVLVLGAALAHRLEQVAAAAALPRPRGPRSRGRRRSRAAPWRCATCAWRFTSSGVPQATSSPPASPPSGPRSISQSEARMTSRLCSMTTIEWPASRSFRNERISLAMSSKCRPGGRLVEHEERAAPGQRLPAGARVLRRLGEEAGELEALRLAAGERRHRLAELHVLEADVDDRLQPAHHLAVVAEQLHRLGDGELEDVGDAEAARRRRRAAGARS